MRRQYKNSCEAAKKKLSEGKTKLYYRWALYTINNLEIESQFIADKKFTIY
jgi:hypothetical protein